MPNAARLTDAVDGTTAGEHSGHVPPHSPEPFTGEISGACSGDVRVNGLAAATVGSITTERDGCCGSSRGAVAHAVADYQTWQRAIGRDINPSQLVHMVMDAGAKRVTVTAPTYTAVDATKVSALQGDAVISYGGLEDD